MNQESQPITPSCKHENSEHVRWKTRVEWIESDYAIIARMRRCLDCNTTFFTFEDIEYGPEANEIIFRRSVSVYFMQLLRKGVIGGVIPWGWPFPYKPSEVVDSLRFQCPDQPPNILTLLRTKTHSLTHRIPISEFNYPLPGEEDFIRAWGLKNLIIKPVN